MEDEKTRAIAQLARVKNVGPARAQLLYEQLQIRTLDELVAAAKAHKLRSLSGIGEKTEATILMSAKRQAQQARKEQARRDTSEAEFLTEQDLISSSPATSPEASDAEFISEDELLSAAPGAVELTAASAESLAIEEELAARSGASLSLPSDIARELDALEDALAKLHAEPSDPSALEAVTSPSQEFALPEEAYSPGPLEPSLSPDTWAGLLSEASAPSLAQLEPDAAAPSLLQDALPGAVVVEPGQEPWLAELEDALKLNPPEQAAAAPATDAGSPEPDQPAEEAPEQDEPEQDEPAPTPKLNILRRATRPALDVEVSPGPEPQAPETSAPTPDDGWAGLISESTVASEAQAQAAPEATPRPEPELVPEPAEPERAVELESATPAFEPSPAPQPEPEPEPAPEADEAPEQAPEQALEQDPMASPGGEPSLEADAPSPAPEAAAQLSDATAVVAAAEPDAGASAEAEAASEAEPELVAEPAPALEPASTQAQASSTPSAQPSAQTSRERFLSVLICPHCGHDTFSARHSSIMCQACRREYALTHDVVDMAPPLREGPTGLAQRLMETSLYARLYEDVMRPKLTRVVTTRTLEQEYELATRMLELSEGVRLLDVACGTGNFTRRFARALAERGIDDALIVAMDLSWPMLTQAAALLEREQLTPRVHLLRGDATRMPLSRGSFDRVHCAGALHMMEDVDEALRNFARVLRPDGLLVVGTFVRGQGLVRRALKRAAATPTQFRWFEPKALRRQLHAAGFEILEESLSQDALTLSARRI